MPSSASILPPLPPSSPYTPLFRSRARLKNSASSIQRPPACACLCKPTPFGRRTGNTANPSRLAFQTPPATAVSWSPLRSTSCAQSTDRKSTRLNSSHVAISYAVFCFYPPPAPSLLPLHAALPISRAAENLREQHSAAAGLCVFVQTNPFRAQDRQYSQSITAGLPNPTSDSRQLVTAAVNQLRSIYRAGYKYKRAGVMLLELSAAAHQQSDLLAGPQNPASKALMRTLDDINRTMGRGTVGFAAERLSAQWRSQSAHRTPAYTTRWEDIPKMAALR